jgi:hypothetical protein
MRFTRLLIWLFVLNLTCVFSQENPRVIVFNSPESNTITKKDTYPNLLKISVIEAMAGDLSFYYERILAKNLSGEIGLGLTTKGLFSTDIQDPNTDIFRQSKTGISFGFGMRYYPFRAVEDYYFAPELKYRFSQNTYTPNLTDNFQESKSMLNVRMTFGYVFFIDDRIFLDLFASLGIASIKEIDYINVFNNETFQDEPVERITKSPSVRFSIGLKFGLNFGMNKTASY